MVNKGEAAAEILSPSDWQKEHDDQLRDDQGIIRVRRGHSSTANSLPRPATDGDVPPESDQDLKDYSYIASTGSVPEEPDSVRDLIDHPENYTEVVRPSLRTVKGAKEGFEHFKKQVEKLREERKAG